MKPLPHCMLYTPDEELQRRLKAFLRSLATVQYCPRPEDVDRHLRRKAPALLILDTRAAESRDILSHVYTTYPDTVTIAMGVHRSDPMRAAQQLGVFANEDVKADRQRIQAQVARGLEHLRLMEENMLLREAATGNGAHPVPAPARPSSRLQLPHFSRAIRNVDNVEALLDGIVEGLASSMMVSRVGIFARASGQATYRLRAGIRYLQETAELEYREGDPLVYFLDVHAHLVSRGNLEHIEHPPDRMLLRQTLEALGAELVIPMHTRGRLLGWLFVGHRATGLPFEYQDLEDLLNIAEHSTTILDNALLYEEVQVQKTLAETVLQSMPTGTVAVSPDGRVRWFNTAAEHILGCRAQDVLEAEAESLGGHLADLLRRTLAGEPTLQPEEWTAKATGRSLAAVTRRLVDGETCLGAVALIHDLTTEHQLREKEEQLERAVFWTELAASMSHEVRNPLVAIKTFAQLLPERYEDPEFRSEFSKLVSNEVDRLNKIIEQINDFAHPPDLKFREVDIDHTLQKSLDMATLRMPRNGIHVDASVPKHLPAIDGDEEALAECFAQLITNAMEASLKRKNPQISIRAEEIPPVNGDPPTVKVTVRDNGEGIPQDIREKVFSPFCTTKARGMGLGLPIVRRTVIDHNGRVEIATGKKGTEVSVTLPESAPPPESETAPRADGGANGKGGNGAGS